MRLGIRVFSFISHADLPRLCEEIEILVRDNDLKGVVRHDSALNLYRYAITMIVIMNVPVRTNTGGTLPMM